MKKLTIFTNLSVRGPHVKLKRENSNFYCKEKEIKGANKTSRTSETMNLAIKSVVYVHH